MNPSLHAVANQACGKISYLLDLYFPPEWFKAALTLALLSTWVLVAVFAYLNHYTRRHYFALWLVGWLFYALWITANITFLEASDPRSWEWVKLICIGFCALFLFWGALEFSGNPRGQREMGLMILLMVCWSFAARHHLKESFWLSFPLFATLSLASFLASIFFFQRRLNQRYIGAGLLGFGFALWGCQMALHPFLEFNQALHPTSFAWGSVTQLVIAIGMIVLVLEEVRSETRTLRDQVKADARLARRLQREIKISEGKYEHLFETAGDAIFILDPHNFQILDVNRMAQALTGYSREELLRLRFTQFFSFLRDKEKEIMANPAQLQSAFAAYGNMSLERKDTTLVLTEGSASLADYTVEKVVQVFLREVSERRRLEQQLRQAEKLSALGQLISGVAHELNNPLAVISGYAQLLSMRTGLDPKTQENLLKIQRESERASKIVQNFLTFARKHPMEKANSNLNKLLEVSLELLDYDLRASGVRLTREFQTDLPPVFVDPNQIEQVFLNLISNAVHAMEGNTREKTLTIRTEGSSGLVRTIVTDSGSGISPSILSKIFDPFFTTKKVGVGTGLGLSISYSIIKEHSGAITAQNRSEGGASFTVELPISRVKAPQEEVSTLPEAKASRSSRLHRVLVVDDENAILDIFAELLVDFSCRVHGVSNGLQAMEYLQNRDVDLILCDLKMPGMDGKRFFEEIKLKKPELVKKIIFITGDTNSPRTTEFLQNSGVNWFPKPFNFSEIETLLTDHFQRIEDKSKTTHSISLAANADAHRGQSGEKKLGPVPGKKD